MQGNCETSPSSGANRSSGCGMYFGWSFVSGTLPIKVQLELSMNCCGLFSVLTFDFATLQMADEMVHGAKDSLRPVSRNKSIEIEAYKELPTMGRDNCAGIMCVQRHDIKFKNIWLKSIRFSFTLVHRMGCETTTNCILGGSALGSRRETSYETGRRAASDLVQSIEGGSRAITSYRIKSLYLWLWPKE